MAATQFAANTLAARPAAVASRPARRGLRVQAAAYNGAYAEELVATARKIASTGKGILAMDESNATCGKRLESVGLENTVENRQAYRELLVSTPGLGQYISGAILFEETLFQDTRKGTSMVDELNKNGIVPGIKVDKGLHPLDNSNNESWCAGLDGLSQRCADYYKQGARFAKWRSVVSIPAGPSAIAVRDCAYGLARYAAIAQNAGLVPIVEPEILLDGDHDIDRTLEVAEMTWAETFKYLADNNVLFEGILLKPSMVTPGAEHAKRSTPDEVAAYTLRMLRRRVPPAVPGIMFLSGGQSELESTLNLNAMNQSPNPWHVSFSYARALQNTVLKTWKGEEGNVEAAQAMLLKRAKANSDAQQGKYTADGESAEAAKGMFEKGYVY
ncbi:putative fructose-bisphosphate aldolase chloroplastic [Micractinium conductrix]|uniref:Fructose-bisphosphate aldolase n=1 Tax=Micractinium conductrix TaxID=554055 RepID=A0A2P6VK14_9CHLO|nr:putative fructose-bisphosphate aldolase chloroplastic [Micractinium conductrix]|eukprot:PSC74433.1 putative fructose-bisphosphate aldolase chloroplastic [Micractinium conductrix]